MTVCTNQPEGVLSLIGQALVKSRPKRSSGNLNDSLANKALHRAIDGEYLSFEEITALLNFDEKSVQVESLMAAAHEKAMAISGGRGQIWLAIGLDSAPCPYDCSFCAFAQKWRASTDSWRLETEQVLKLIKENDQPGVSNITLRTTAIYPFEDLLKIGALASPLKHARLTANIGDFRSDEAEKLLRSGFKTIYHAWRLGEGVDTKIHPEERLATINSIKKSNLDLAALVEPVGGEHTAEELAERIVAYRKAGAALSGAMSRVNIPGTPKADCPGISARRLAQITAVIRLALSSATHSICSHPPDPEVARAGANTVVVDSGAVPRDLNIACQPWRAFSIAEARKLLWRAGYEI